MSVDTIPDIRERERDELKELEVLIDAMRAIDTHSDNLSNFWDMFACTQVYYEFLKEDAFQCPFSDNTYHLAKYTIYNRYILIAKEMIEYIKYLPIALYVIIDGLLTERDLVFEANMINLMEYANMDFLSLENFYNRDGTLMELNELIEEAQHNIDGSRHPIQFRNLNSDECMQYYERMVLTFQKYEMWLKRRYNVQFENLFIRLMGIANNKEHIARYLRGEEW